MKKNLKLYNVGDIVITRKGSKISGTIPFENKEGVITDINFSGKEKRISYKIKFQGIAGSYHFHLYQEDIMKKKNKPQEDSLKEKLIMTFDFRVLLNNYLKANSKSFRPSSKQKQNWIQEMKTNTKIWLQEEMNKTVETLVAGSIPKDILEMK